MDAETQSRSPREMDTIASDLATLKRDFAVLLADLKAGTLGQAKQAKAVADDAVEQIGAKASDLFGVASSQAEKGAKLLAQELDERPLTSLLVAFSVGFIASRLLSR